MPLELQT
jgi:hypothetical protein